LPQLGLLCGLCPWCVSVVVVAEAAGGSGEWRTFGERAIYDSPEVWLGQVDVGLPGGERIWRHVVRMPRSALMVLLDERGRVLLLWRYRFVQGRWGWELPGGLVDEGEEPGEAAARELEEQAGYRAGEVRRLVSFQPAAESADGEHVVFIGRDGERVGDPVSSEGIGRAEWVSLESVPGMIAGGEVWNSGSVVGLLQALAEKA
jgi:8-oxo-dGDP phosphatase